MHVAGELSPAQATAYRLADNRTNEETSWDPELLALEIAELAGLDYDIDVLGFDREELAALPDPADERPQRPRRGARAARRADHQARRPLDFGSHRLLCGDATKRRRRARA